MKMKNLIILRRTQLVIVSFIKPYRNAVYKCWISVRYYEIGDIWFYPKFVYHPSQNNVTRFPGFVVLYLSSRRDRTAEDLGTLFCGVYTLSMQTIYLTLSKQVAEGNVFRKHTVYLNLLCTFLWSDISYLKIKVFY